MNRSALLLGLLTVLGPLPALAQLTPGVGGGGAGASAPQPQARVPDFAPPGLPGAGAPQLKTSLPVAHATSGDPTTALFTAVNAGDYTGAQDAISRGADLNAQNALGETPLDLSIALNRSTITFLLLSARNELGDDASSATPASTAMPAPAPARHPKTSHFAPASMARPPAPVVLGNNPGTPDPAAGFLGFGPKS